MDFYFTPVLNLFAFSYQFCGFGLVSTCFFLTSSCESLCSWINPYHYCISYVMFLHLGPSTSLCLFTLETRFFFILFSFLDICFVYSDIPSFSALLLEFLWSHRQNLRVHLVLKTTMTSVSKIQLCLKVNCTTVYQ